MASKKRQKPAEVTVKDVLGAGRDMMQRSEMKMGTIEVEERRFRDMFGASPEVALIAWSMLSTLGLIPIGDTLTHFLWTLCFLKVYPKQGPLSVLCGNADPKTIKKWVYLFIDALACLEPYIVSIE
jgi:hypothetical protein